MKRTSHILSVFLCLLAATSLSFSQTVYTFTNAGATGRFGPTQSQINSAYGSTNLNNNVTINTQGVQEWTVPASGTYTIEVWGARGGGASGSNYGKGARMKGDFTLTQGDVLRIVVGQMGGQQNSGSGGGGTFVTKKTGSALSQSTALIVAGGGGGVYTSSSAIHNSHAVTSNNGQSTQNKSGGSNGGGGSGDSGSGASGGGGLTGNGTSGSYGTFGEAFVNGAEGGNHGSNAQCIGGFGGGGGTHGNTGGGGGGGGYSGGAGGRHDNNYGNGGGGGSYNNGSNQSNEGGIWDSHGKVVIEACTGFCFEGFSVANDNSYADVTLSTGGYSANNGSGAIATSDFTLSFDRNGGVASNATISSIKKNNNTSEGSAGALTGGETVLRLFLNLTGLPVGVERISLKPANNTSVYNSSGTAMQTTSQVSAFLKDQNGPYIISSLVNSANSQVSVTFSEAAYSTNGGSGSLATSDFSLAISGGAATLNNATPTSISQSSNTYTLGFSVSGTADGLEVLTVSPVANSIYDASGNASTALQNNNTINLYDKRLAQNTNLEHDLNYSVYNNLIQMDEDSYVLSYSGNGTDGYLQTFTVSKDGNSITQVLEKEWATNGEVTRQSLIRMSEDLYLMAYYGYRSGIRHDGVSVSNTWGQWLTVFQIKSDGSVISELGNYLFDTYSNSDPHHNLLKINDDTYALAYRSYNYGPETSSQWGGWVKTFKVNGANISHISEENIRDNDSEFYESSWQHLGGTKYALAHSGSGTDGYITTLDISADGETITQIVQVEHDISYNRMNQLQKVDEDTYLLSYEGTSGDGFMKTFTIPTNGASINEIAELEHDTENGQWGSLIPIDDNKFALAYRTGDSDGNIKFFTVPDDGSSITEGLILEHETDNNQYNSLVMMDHDNFLLAHQGSSSDGFVKTFNFTQTATSMQPKISSVQIANDNSAIAVTMNEPVFRTTGGNGALEKEDFALSISGGNATLASATPTSISISGNVYTLGLNLSGQASGFEKITVMPASGSSIYDASNNTASASYQLNNSAFLKATGSPVITQTTIDAFNTEISVKFLKPIYNTNGGSGLPQVSDFSLSLSNGTAILTSATPTAISGGFGPEIKLKFSTSGVADGNETITVTPIANQLWDIDGTVVSNSQSNNTVDMNLSFMNPIVNFEHNGSNGTHNDIIHIAGDVYALAYEGASNKATISTIKITTAGSVTNSSFVATEEHDSNNGEQNELIHLSGDKYVLFYKGQDGDGFAKVFKITANGETIEQLSSTLEFEPNYYSEGSAVRMTDSTLVFAWAGQSYDGFIKTFNVASDGSTITEIQQREHDGSYGQYNSMVRVDEDTYVLSYNGSNNYGRVQTFTIPPDGSSITEVANAAFSDNGYSYFNSLVQVDHDTYLNAGYSYNTSESSGYYGVLETFNIPSDGSTITSVANLKYSTVNTGKYNKLLKLNANEYILAFQGSNSDGYLEMYTVSSDGETITKKWQNEFDTDNAWNDLVRIDKNTIALTYAGSGSDGYIQTFDIGTSDNAGPAITANSINYENSQFTIALNEAAYNTNGGSGDLEVSDFALSITGGTATLSSATPTSISKIGDSQYVLGFSLSGTANGSEVLKAVPIQNAVFDVNGTASATNQSNNTVNLFEKVLPIISSSALASDNATVAVTFSEAVFKSRSASGTGFAGTGDLEVADFAFSIAGGVATLGSATPTSIAKSGNVYTLGINYIGLPNGSEVLTVTPVQDQIYDTKGNIATTSQSNNTRTLNAEKIRVAKTLEFETGNMQSPALLKRDTDTYVVAFSYSTNNRNSDGYMSAFNISADGETLTETSINGNSSRWQWESNDYQQGQWAKVDEDTYALIYWDYGNGGYITTFDINDDASTISTKKSRHQFSQSTSTWDGYYPDIIEFGSNMFVVAYQDNSNRGIVKTFTISNDGSTITEKDFEYLISSSNNSNMAWNSMVKVDNNTVAIAHNGAAGGAEGWITTFNVDPTTGVISGASGSSNKYVNRLKHDNVLGKFNSLVKLGGNIYVLAYAGSGDDGFITSFTISDDGTTITEIEEHEHDNKQGYYNDLIAIGDEALLLVYSGEDTGGGTNYDGYIKSISINSNGTGISIAKSIEFETSKGHHTKIADIDGNTFAVVSEGSGYDGFMRTFNVRASDQSSPTITSRTLAADNLTINITFNEDVYAISNGTGELEVSDFVLSISGGSAGLSSVTPSSITRESNIYTLGISLNSPASGAETVTVNPAANSIFDLAGNIATTNQSNNSATLNDKLGPSITNIAVAGNNATVDVTLAETAYPGVPNSGALTVEDWVLSIPDTNSTAKLGSATPTSISKSGNVYTLGMNIQGTPDGNETLVVNPAANSIYDALDNISSTTQTNNSAKLKDKTPATVQSISVAANNATIAVTMSEPIFNASNGQGALEKSDFAFTMSGGSAVLVNAAPTSIAASGNVYTLGINLSGTANGAEVVAVTPVASSIYDAVGNVSLTEQSGNTANLKDKASPIFSALDLANNNGTIAVTFSEAVFSKDDGTGSLDSLDFTLSLTGSGATLSQAKPTTITKNGNVYTLGIGLEGTPSGSEVLTVSPVADAIFDGSGNVAITNQTINKKTLIDKLAPTISSVVLSSDNSTAAVTFSEIVFKASNGNGDLEPADFVMTISGGRAKLKSATPTSVSKNGTTFTLGLDIQGTGTGKEVLAVIPKESSIYDNAGNVALSTQTTNTGKTKDLTGPIILSITPKSDNTALIVEFDEEAFTDPNGSAILDTSDITLSLKGGNAVLTSPKPTSFSRTGASYTLGLALNGKVNGFEDITVQVQFNAIYDSLGNVSSPIQAVNSTFLIDQTAPTFAALKVEEDNSSVNVSFSNPVYNATGGSGSLEKEDFVLSMAGGTAKLLSQTPVTLTYVDSSNTYKLGLSLEGVPDGYEQITLSPIENSIFDAANNVASTVQARRKINLVDKALPVITRIDIVPSNATVTVYMSEPVFSSALGSGELTFADFLLSITGGTASLPLPFPDGIVKVNDSTFALGIKTEGIQSGREVMTVRPSPGSVYDRTGNESDFFTQTNNSKNLNDKQRPVRPTGLVAIPGDRKVTLGWNLSADADIEKYYIYYATSPNPTVVMDSTNNAEESSRLITPLINGTTYYFKVGAVDTSKNVSPLTLEANASPIKGSVYTVKTDTSGDYSDIQSAINVTQDIDTVLIYPGTYQGGINFSGKKIVVGSLYLTTGDTAYIDSTIIDGDASSSVATFISGEDSTAVLTGLSLINGYTTINGGGGIRIENSSPRIKNLKISNNIANVGGAGISCEACDSRITDTEVTNNTVTGIGGGIRVFNGSNPELLNVSIQNNTATLNGGGISYEGLPGNSTIQTMNRVTISGNSSSEGVGGGAYLYSSTVHASRAYIQNNTALSKGGGISVEWASELNIENAFISGNVLTDGVQGSNIYIGKSNQLIGSNEKLIAMNVNMIDTVALSDENLFSMYTNGLVKPLLINSIAIGRLDAAIPTSNFDLNYSFCNDCSNLLSFAVNPGNLTGSAGFIDFDKGEFDLGDNSLLLSAATSSFTTVANEKYFAPLTDIRGTQRPIPFGSQLDIGAYESEFSGRTLAATGITDGLSVNNEIDYSNITSTLSARWNPYLGDSTNTYSYDYAIGDSGRANNVKDWTANGFNTQVTVTGLELSNSVTYYISVRIKNAAGDLLGTLITDGIFIDTQNPIINGISDGIDNDIDWYGALSTGRIIVNVSDNSGIGTYEYSIGSAPGDRDVMNWKLGQDSVGTFSVEGFQEEVTYYANARATDRVGFVSETVSSDGFKMDYTLPTAGTVTVNNAFQSDTSFMIFNWSGFADAHSGMSSYDVMIGLSEGGSDIAPRRPTESLESVTVSGLSLKNNVVYYGTIIGIDSVGNEISSNAPSITIDLVPPSIGTVADGDAEDLDWLNDSADVSVNWNGFSDLNGIGSYDVALGTSPGGVNIKDWEDSGADSSHTFTGLQLNPNINYYFSVRAYDALGNVSEAVASDGFKVDIIGPQVASSSVPQDSPLNIFSATVIDYALTEAIETFSVDIQSNQGDMVNIAPVNELLGNTVRVSFTPPFTSADQITVDLTITDVAGNSNTTQYVYTVGFLADYNKDDSFGADDLLTFTNAWGAGDITKELGPVTGTAPYFRPQPDGVFDLRDGMAFVRMWRWYQSNSSGKILAKQLPSIGKQVAIETAPDHFTIVPPRGTKAVEVVVSYPVKDIDLSMASIEAVTDQAITLTWVDTASGSILLHSAQLKGSSAPIRIDVGHLQKELDVPIDISYQFIGKDSRMIGSGNTVHEIMPVPTEFALHNNYPNPFNPTTTINYDLPQDGSVRLIIYDVMGREVTRLVNGFTPAGYHSVRWDARNKMGENVSAGVYFYHLQSGTFVKTQKMVLLK